MEKTGIIWTEKTWNPFRFTNTDNNKKGWFCIKVNQGCKHCYAETLNMKWGNGLEFNHKNVDKVKPFLASLNDPSKWKEPSLVFVNSMTDFFLPIIPDEFRHQVISIMEATPQHEYQVLTKLPHLMHEWSRKKRKLPANFWAGMTVPSDGARINGGFLDHFLKVEAEIKFISAEPLIAPINFHQSELEQIQWMITGGESGTHLWKDDIAEKRALVRYNRTAKVWELREDRADWIRHIRDACVKAGTKFFHKQHGGSFPEAAGRLLDGQTWNEMPRLPGGKEWINNDYLKEIEKKIGKNYGQELY